MRAESRKTEGLRKSKKIIKWKADFLTNEFGYAIIILLGRSASRHAGLTKDNCEVPESDRESSAKEECYDIIAGKRATAADI